MAQDFTTDNGKVTRVWWPMDLFSVCDDDGDCAGPRHQYDDARRTFVVNRIMELIAAEFPNATDLDVAYTDRFSPRIEGNDGSDVHEHGYEIMQRLEEQAGSEARKALPNHGEMTYEVLVQPNEFGLDRDALWLITGDLSTAHQNARNYVDLKDRTMARIVAQTGTEGWEFELVHKPNNQWELVKDTIPPMTDREDDEPTEGEDDDPRCVCGTYKSEHALCGCSDGFQTPESWAKEVEAIVEHVERFDEGRAHDDDEPEIDDEQDMKGNTLPMIEAMLNDDAITREEANALESKPFAEVKARFTETVG